MLCPMSKDLLEPFCSFPVTNDTCTSGNERQTVLSPMGMSNPKPCRDLISWSWEIGESEFPYLTGLSVPRP